MMIDPQFYQTLEKMTQQERDIYVIECKKLIKEFDNIVQNVMHKSQNAIYDCLHNDCGNNTQTYCHLMQKNGVLSHIAQDNHLLQPQISSPYKWLGKTSDILEMRKIGINKVFSGKLFCDKHDTELFKNFEVKTPDFHDYETQLLLCYRSMCYELWQNYYNINYSNESIRKLSELLDDVKLRNDIPKIVLQENLNDIKQRIDQQIYEIGTTNIDIAQLIKLRKYFLNALFNINSYSMKFICIETRQLPISASLIVSSEKYYNDQLQNNPYFLQVIPQFNKSYIIFGYFHELSDEWLDSYCSRFSMLEENEILVELTRLITTRNMAWCVSPNFYSNLSENIKQKIKDDYIKYYENKFDDEYWYKYDKWNLFN